MARWRLTEPHYLKVPGTFWEQNETDRETGRRKRIEHPVPLYLNPSHPSDWTHKPSGLGHITAGGNSFTEGVIIVAYKDKTDDKKDIIFEGDPTPGMEPIDDEAQAISDSFKERWANINTFIDGMSKQEEVMMKSQEALLKAVADSQNQMKDMMATLVATQQQLAQLMMG